MPHPSDLPHPKSYLSVEMLMRLGQVTGQRLDTQRLRHLLDAGAGRAEGDPLAHLGMVASELGLRLTPSRMPLAEAVWQAQTDAPVVLWCGPESRFLIVSYAGAFKVRLACYENATMDSMTISRARLAARMGLRSVADPVEAGLIHPQSPQKAASIEIAHDDSELASRYGTFSHRKQHEEHQAGDGSSHDHHHHMSPFRRLLGLLRPERRDIMLLLIFSMFSGVLYLALPLAVDTVVTNLAFGSQSKPYLQALVVIAGMLTLCLLLQALIIGFQHYVAELIQRRIFVRTAGELAHRLPRVQPEAMEGTYGPELVNRFLDVATVQKNSAYFLLDGINLLAASLIGMVLLAFYHPLLMAFVAVLILLIVFVAWLLGRKAVTTAIQESRSKYDLVGWFEEIAAFPFLFKGPGGYEMAYQRTNVLASEYLHARSRHYHVLFGQVAGLLLVSVLASVALLLLGTWLVLSQQITLGQLVASELIMSGIVTALVKLGKKFETWYDTMAATDKLGHLLDLVTEPQGGEMPAQPDQPHGLRVTAKDMSFGHLDSLMLFENLDFDIKPGDRVGLYGPQGSGVSSLLELLFAVRQPTGGHLSFDGLDSRNWHLENLHSRIQLLRRDEFIDGTIIENLRLGRADIAIEEVRSALDKVGVLDDLLQRPEGLNLRLRVGGAPLSTSQRIALLVARAFVQQPSLLLIDKLFDGLDKATLQHLSQLVLDARLPWTVIVATRMRDILTLCDQTLELSGKARASPA